MQAVTFGTSGITSEQSRMASGVHAWRTASLPWAAAPSTRQKRTAASKISVQAKRTIRMMYSPGLVTPLALSRRISVGTVLADNERRRRTHRWWMHLSSGASIAPTPAWSRWRKYDFVIRNRLVCYFAGTEASAASNAFVYENSSRHYWRR